MATSIMGRAIFIFSGLLSLQCVQYLPPVGSPQDPLVAHYALEAATAGPNTMVALLEIVVDTPLGDRSIRANAVVRAPSDLRLEFLTPTDQLAAIVLSSGGKTIVYERGENTCQIQENCKEIALPGLPLAVRAQDLVSLLVHGAIRVPEDGTLDWEKNDGTVVVAASSDTGMAPEIHLEPCTLRMRSSVWRDGDRSIRLRASVPEKDAVHFELPEYGMEIHVRYPLNDRGLPVGNDAFNWECPVGVQSEIRRCGNGEWE